MKIFSVTENDIAVVSSFKVQHGFASNFHRKTYREHRTEREPYPFAHVGAVSAFVEKFRENLALEIGCGVGMHPLLAATRESKVGWIAIEHTRAKFEKFAHAHSMQQSPNLLPLHGNALSIATHLLPPESLKKILILHPNPNQKNRAKRWFQMPFLGTLLTKLANGGTLTLASNQRWYAEEALELGTELWGLNLTQNQQWQLGVSEPGKSDELPFFPRTHFEKKYWERGQTIFNLVFQKSGAAKPFHEGFSE